MDLPLSMLLLLSEPEQDSVFGLSNKTDMFRCQESFKEPRSTCLEPAFGAGSSRSEK